MCLVILVLLDDLLLGLLVVNRVGTRWWSVSTGRMLLGSRRDTYIPFLKASWRLCVGVSVLGCVRVVVVVDQEYDYKCIYACTTLPCPRATLLLAAVPLISFLPGRPRDRRLALPYSIIVGPSILVAAVQGRRAVADAWRAQWLSAIPAWPAVPRSRLSHRGAHSRLPTTSSPPWTTLARRLCAIQSKC